MGADLPSADLHRLLQKARELQIPVLTRRAGDDFQFGGASIRILAPSVDPETHLWRANDDCLVMQVSYGKTSALLEGDAEPQVERRIANAGVRANLLRVAHHGSARATSPALLAGLRPQYGVISVGARNVYGHPRMEVLTRLAQAEVKTYRTDLDGAVTFYLDGTSVSPGLAVLH